VLQRQRIVTVAVMAMATATLQGQTARRDSPAFEVASVKPNKSGDASLRLDIQPGGRFIAANIPLKQFIRAAYTLQLHQIADAPAWVDSERFDITAISDRDLTVSTPWTPGGRYALVQLMMQSLLADRFKMVSHIEERQAQGYELVLHRPGDSSKLTPANRPCETACGMRPGPGTLAARGVPMPTLAEFLSQVTGRLVTDGTGVAGNFDLDLKWTPEAQLRPDSEAPSVFTALQEQLGLRLEPRRGPLTVLVVDSIDRPTAD
jgi:uncharacterized protein (TIGR03435 family)